MKPPGPFRVRDAISRALGTRQGMADDEEPQEGGDGLAQRSFFHVNEIGIRFAGGTRRTLRRETEPINTGSRCLLT